jgi:hypothetical protein
MGHYDEFYEAEAREHQRHLDENYEKCARCGKHIMNKKVIINGEPYHSEGDSFVSAALVKKPVYLCDILTRLETVEAYIQQLRR